MQTVATAATAATAARNRFRVQPPRVRLLGDPARADMRLISDAVTPAMTAEEEVAAFTRRDACLDAAWGAVLMVLGGERPSGDRDWQALRDAQALALAVANPREETAIIRTEAALRRSVDRIVRTQLALTAAIASQLMHARPGSMGVDDAVQEANIGLLKAIRRFDASRGLRLSTFAVQWMRHHVGRAYVDTARTIRLPSHINETGNALRRAAREMGAMDVASACASDMASVARISGRSVDRITTTITAPRTRSGDEVLRSSQANSEGDSRTLFDLVADPAPAPVDTIADEQVCAQVRRAVDTLPATHAIILRRRFGLDGDDPETLQQVGERFNLSRERIRQIEVVALSKARKACPGLAGVVSL